MPEARPIRCLPLVVALALAAPVAAAVEAAPALAAAGARAHAPEESAPTPFTADQIRHACPAGRLFRFRVERDGKVTLNQTRFLKSTAEGADIEVSTLDGKGAVIESRTSHLSWAELQGHARFPKAATRITEEKVTTVLGTFDALVYHVSDPSGSTTHFVFARSRPGPPVLFWTEAGGRTVSRGEMVAYE